MTDAGEVQGSARSGYYPVTLSSVLREVRGTNDRVAIVGLPCFVKGVRLAVKQDSQLGRRVRVLAGLVCGGTRSRFYAEYLCALGGGMPNALEQVDFRVKEGSERAGEFGFRFSCRAGSGRNEGMVAAQERGRLWSQRYFEPRACRFCDDVFCETADVVFMDAWLDRYMRDPRGTNLVLTRKTWITDLLVQAAEAGAVTLEDVPVTDLICSQQEVTRRKRALLAERLAASADDAVPDRRLRPAVIGALRRAQLRMAERLIGRSREAFADALERSEGPADVIQDFKQAMRGPETLARLGRGLARRLSGRRANQPIEQRDVAARPAESLAGRIS
jgi:coenzyme F420-reducing hydrogenase beta subunit